MLTEIISIRFIVSELKPSSEVAKAKFIILKSNYLLFLTIFCKKLKFLKACKKCCCFITELFAFIFDPDLFFNWFIVTF